MLNRRAFLAVAASTMLPAPSFAAGQSGSGTTRWCFDNFKSVGGRDLTIVGAPRLVDSPWGTATHFDGTGDGLLLDIHPLAGAHTFRIDALFHPDGGAFAQRWLHLESNETPPVAEGTGSTRTLFEIRVVGDRWYLDAFVTGAGYKQAMMEPELTFPLGRWYKVTQTFDGRTYRSYVNGQPQMARELEFKAQGPGRAAVGMRMNRVSFFRGAIREVLFTSPYH